MGMIRQFTPSCDVPECLESADWGEWTSAYAAERAREEGWKISGGVHICPEHVADGWTFSMIPKRDH